MLDYNVQKFRNSETLQPLIIAGSLTESKAEKLAGSGLNLSHLRVAYQRDGRQGIEALFGDKMVGTTGRIWVTKTKRFIDIVYKYLRANFYVLYMENISF